jgi:hypothetical protein
MFGELLRTHYLRDCELCSADYLREDALVYFADRRTPEDALRLIMHAVLEPLNTGF